MCVCVCVCVNLAKTPGNLMSLQYVRTTCSTSHSLLWDGSLAVCVCVRVFVCVYVCVLVFCILCLCVVIHINYCY